MFFAIKKEDTTRVVKATNYNDLTVKASNLFKVNPNTAVLKFHEPDGEEMTLDSEDTYEYIEMRVNEIRAKNANYKPSLTLEGDTSLAKPASSAQLASQTSSVSRVSEIVKAVKPIEEKKLDNQEAEKAQIIFKDRDTLVASSEKEDDLQRGVTVEELNALLDDQNEETKASAQASRSLTAKLEAPSIEEIVMSNVQSPALTNLPSQENDSNQMPSPKMSEIASVPQNMDHSVSAPPNIAQQPALQSKNTQMLLAEMGEDLAGLGVGGLAVDYENNQLMKQPTAIAHDPAMTSAQTKPLEAIQTSSQVSAAQVQRPQPSLADQAKQFDNDEAHAAHEQLFNPSYQATIKEINRNSNRESRAQSQVIRKGAPKESNDSLAESVGLQEPNIGVAPLQEEEKIAVSNSESEPESSTTIRRLTTDVAQSEVSDQAPPIMKTATTHMFAPVVVNPAKPDALELPLQKQKTIETSFVTDFSMKNYSQMGSVAQAQAQSQHMTEKEQKLAHSLKQTQVMLSNLMMGYERQKEEIRQQKQQIQELTAKNQQLMANQSPAQMTQIPCFRCDGRQTEKGRPDPCRRCNGTGRVNTNHEKFLIEMIQSQVKKQMEVTEKQKEIRKSPNLVQHPGVTCTICNACPLQGVRYMSLENTEVNICETCELQTQYSQKNAMAVITQPQLYPDEFIQSHEQLSERRKAARAQEIISESLVRQESINETKSIYAAKFQYMSLKKNCVFKKGDTIENVWTFKNSGNQTIPKGVKLLMVAGDQDLNVPNMQVESDVKPGEFFKLKISVKAPAQPRHYSAGYSLFDEQGNFFGDKVVLDTIVEDDCSESVILAEMMDNVDMNMNMSSNKVDFNKMVPRNERVSMMIHKGPQTNSNIGQQPVPVANAPPAQVPPPPMSMANPQPNPAVGGWGAKPPAPQPQVQPFRPPIPAGGPPQMQPQAPSQMPPNNPSMQQPPQMQPGAPSWGMPPQVPQASQEKSAFDDSRDSMVGQQPAFQPPPVPFGQPPQDPNFKPPARPTWGMPPPAVGAPPVGQPPMGQPPIGQPPMGQPAMGQPPMGQPAPAQAAPQDFFNQAPMRYPTMSGLKIDAAGVSNKDEEAKSAPVASFSQPPDMPKPALKPPTQNIVEYGSKPPSLPSASGSGEPKSVAFKEPTTYNEKLEQAYPASRNSSDPSNRQMRECFFTMKDFGYDNFEKNSVIITKFKNQGKLDSMAEIAAELEQSYNGGRQSFAAAANPAPQVHVPPPLAQPQPQPAPPMARQDSLVVDQKKIAYSEKVNKKLKDPQKTIMLQLMELGYDDYDKNLKVVKKEKRPDIGTLLDKIVTAYNKK